MSDRTRSEPLDLYHVILVVWKKRYLMLSVQFLCLILGWLSSYFATPVYRSEILVQPIEAGDEIQSMNMLSGQLGNIAALAGLDGMSAGGAIKLNNEIIKSRHFILEFIREYKLEADIYAVDSWDESADTVKYDPDVYDAASGEWFIEAEDDKPGRAPTDKELFDKFMENYKTDFNSDAGLLKLSYDHPSPSQSVAILNLLIDQANKILREDALTSASTKIEYIEKKLQDVSIETVKAVFFELIESEIKNQMLAETREDFAYKVIDPAYFPEEIHWPKRPYFAVFFAIFGTLVFVFYAIVEAIRGRALISGPDR